MSAKKVKSKGGSFSYGSHHGIEQFSLFAGGSVYLEIHRVV